jgi:hypothetical protein
VAADASAILELAEDLTTVTIDAIAKSDLELGLEHLAGPSGLGYVWKT